MCECCGGDCRLCEGQMTPPLNEAYKNEVLEAYQEISDTFDDFTQLMRKRVPYEEWPRHLQNVGINPELLGPSDPPVIKLDKQPEMVSIPECAEPSSNQLEDKMISRIKDMGRVQERIKSILDDDIFNDLSKYNTYWQSKHEEENGKLIRLHMKLSCLHDNLWDIMGILRGDEKV